MQKQQVLKSVPDKDNHVCHLTSAHEQDYSLLLTGYKTLFFPGCDCCEGPRIRRGDLMALGAGFPASARGFSKDSENRPSHLSHLALPNSFMYLE